MFSLLGSRNLQLGREGRRKGRREREKERGRDRGGDRETERERRRETGVGTREHRNMTKSYV